MLRRLVLLALLSASCGGSELDLEVQSSRRGEAAAPELASAGVLDKGDGLRVEILEHGSGARASAGSQVVLHYEAFLAGAEQPFDSTYARLAPASFRLSTDAHPRPIEGLRRGLLDLTAGTRAKLSVPAALAYGAAGLPSAGVPADSDLVVDVRLVEVR